MDGTSRLTVVWLGLVLATVVAVVLGEVLDASAAVTVLVLAVALAKVHVVATGFMGLRQGPRWMGFALHAWVVVVLVALSAIYLVQR